MALTDEEKKTLAIVAKCTALLSMFGSGWLFQKICRCKEKRTKVYHRLLLSMSLCDILVSTNIFVGTWAIPAGSEGVYHPKGNEVTCRIQGFLIQFGQATPLYNASLSLYYLLLINYGWKEHHLKKVEPFFHAGALTWAIGTATLALCWDQYHNSNLWCWISSTDQANVLRWALYYGPVWFVILFVTITMILVYRHVYKQETVNEKYNFQEQRRKSIIQRIRKKKKKRTIPIPIPTLHHDNDADAPTSAAAKKKANNHKHSRRVAKQSALYVIAFYLAFIFATLTRLIQTINGKTYYPLLLLFAIFFPMQGFLNFLVYMYPKFVKLWKTKIRGHTPTINGTVTNMFHRFRATSLDPERAPSSTIGANSITTKTSIVHNTNTLNNEFGKINSKAKAKKDANIIHSLYSPQHHHDEDFTSSSNGGMANIAEEEKIEEDYNNSVSGEKQHIVHFSEDHLVTSIPCSTNQEEEEEKKSSNSSVDNLEAVVETVHLPLSRPGNTSLLGSSSFSSASSSPFLEQEYFVDEDITTTETENVVVQESLPRPQPPSIKPIPFDFSERDYTETLDGFYFI